MPMSRALCQSVTYTSWSGSSVRTVARSRVEKCPARAATNSTLGWGSLTSSLAKCRRDEKGVDMTTSSRTGVGSPATVT